MDKPETDSSASFQIQVCYVHPDFQILLDLPVTAGTSIEQAIRQSGILEQAPEIDLSSNQVGIYGNIKTLDTFLRAHDRIEIYRPLLADPKEARRRRVLEISEE
jgi:hypothetical protein